MFRHKIIGEYIFLDLFYFCQPHQQLFTNTENKLSVLRIGHGSNTCGFFSLIFFRSRIGLLLLLLLLKKKIKKIKMFALTSYSSHVSVWSTAEKQSHDSLI